MSDELYDDYNQRVNIHTTRVPKPPAYVPDAYTNKEFWSHESTILEAKLSEMAHGFNDSFTAFEREVNSQECFSTNFPRYLELDRLCQMREDMHIMPTFYRYNRWKKVSSPRKAIDHPSDTNNGHRRSAMQAENEENEVEDTGIRHLHSRYFYARDLTSSTEYANEKVIKEGPLNLEEEVEEVRKMSKRFELRVDEIPRHEIARAAHEMFEGIHSEYVSMQDGQKVIPRQKKNNK